MQVYSDVERTEYAGTVAAEVLRGLERYRGLAPGLERHQTLVAAFIRAGELLQGVGDAEFSAIGADEITERQQAGAALLQALAREVASSWQSGFSLAPALPDGCSSQLALLAEAGTIKTRRPEGYAFYALYPEAYIVAALQSGLGPDTTVIGIRSIGTGLAALVATALGAPQAYTVRPTGHPFDRSLAIGDQLAERLLAHSADYAIVDEGPGLSGSSFNCVADWLVAHGVAESRIHFFPSHLGDLGSAARADHRARWSNAPKHVAGFERVILDAEQPEHRLKHWIGSVVEAPVVQLRDLSGGAWRQLRYDASELWPPADRAMEKRKFLASAGGRQWLAKFAGVGNTGNAKLRLARTLAAAGFSPEPAGLCHGFLITPWVAETEAAVVPTERLLDYLVLRASMPADRPGAALSALFDMAIYNIDQRLGHHVAACMRARLGDAHRLEVIPCCTDNRMQRWEWVHGAGGLQKLDGLDHHAAHDLVGCQDIAWDVAGAAVELELCHAQRDALVEELSARLGRPMDLELVRASELCYLGFQIGLWTMALARNDEMERRRIERLLAGYEHQVLRALNIG